MDFFGFSGILEILDIVFFWFSGRLEILDIGVFLIAWYPGNTGGGRAEAGGRLQGSCSVLPWIIFGTCFLEFPDILEILEI